MSQTAQPTYLTARDIYDYVRNNSYKTFVVTYDDGKSGTITEKERLVATQDGKIYKLAKGSRTKGYILSYSVISTIVGIRLQVKKPTNLVAKYKKYAAKATFPSAFVRKCLAADESKDLYENHLTTGCGVDGEVISLAAIEKYAPYEVARFRKALAEKTDYHSCRFNFRGYDGSLYVEVIKNTNSYYNAGDINAGFAKEYRNCGNGYYYALINDDNFIGVDVD